MVFRYLSLLALAFCWTIANQADASTHRVTPTITWNTSNIDLGIQNEGVAMTPVDLSKFVNNHANSSLTFTSSNLPKWMQLSSAGMITGTPQRADVGPYSGIDFTVSDGTNNATVTGSGTVLITIHPPSWISDPVTIANATEDSAYSINVYPYVLDYEKSSFTYTEVSGSPWIQVDTNGNIYGTPGKANIGTATATVSFTTVINGTTYTQATTFNFNVIHVNHPPRWASNPLPLPNGASTVPYSQNVSSSASDPDAGDTLTFTATAMPAWLTMSAQGVLSGTPTAAGSFSFQAKVTDQGNLSDTTTVTLTITHTNSPPSWTTQTVALADAHEDSAYNGDLNPFITNPDGLPLTFTELTGPTWASVSSTGIISGTPKSANVGVAKFSVKVANSVGSAVASVMLTVDHTNHPPSWVLNPIHLTQPEESAMSADISGYATDPDLNLGDKLTFSLASGPAWGTLSAAGVFSGTPPDSAEGNNTFAVKVTDTGNLSATGQLVVTVTHINHPPVWTQPSITLSPDAKERSAYVGSVASYAMDPDAGDTLSFSKIPNSGATWLTVASNGALSGTPQRANDGANTFQVRVMDPSNAYADVTVTLTVDKVALPPRWRQNPVVLANANEDQAYNFNLSSYAVDDDGNPITFSLVSGPSWMQVSPAGVISGTPHKADIGAVAAVLQVTDNFSNSVTANATGTVVHTPHPPVIGTIPAISIKERSISKYPLEQYVTNPDGGTLNFAAVDSLSWVTLASTGDMTLQPLYANIGTTTFHFKVDNGELSAQGSVSITVARDPRPPVWLQSPVVMQANTNQAFTGTLSGLAQDLDGITLTYKLDAGGPAWLKLDTTSGNLSGTPASTNVGANAFSVEACNDVLCATSPLNITVLPGTQLDTFTIDSTVAGANTEMVWTVDTSSAGTKLLSALRSNVKYLFQALNTAQIHYSQIFLSSDANKWDGLPIAQNSEPMLMNWNDQNAAADFTSRLDYAANSNDDDNNSCSNCFSSPTWTMFRFFQRLPSISEIYHNGYVMPGVPMESILITQQTDHYPAFAKGTAQSSMQPGDYGNQFIAFDEAQKKTLRISSIAPQCPSLVESEGASAGPASTYQTIVNKTSGQSYPMTDCTYNLKPVLQDLATKIISRAYINANTNFSLSATPFSVNSIQVSLGGKVLPGNTGAASDLWSYTNNQITINWFLIDQSTLTPGEKLTVTYRIS